ncbi:MAG: (Fe-S)-binding protein [Hyphomicrobiales bacterium]|nr:(Fe-S)-binding protein [Hyphomicrobiales bacterium]
MGDEKEDGRPSVGLFVTCLVDLMRPAVGFAAVKLLEEAGCEVVVPAGQTCCGQPAFNSGDMADAKAVARTVIDAFANVDYVVIPSGSCAGTIKTHYLELFADEPALTPRVQSLVDKTFELMTFLHDILNIKRIIGSFPKTVTYHDSCSGLRELGIKDQPRALLSGIDGLTIKEMATSETCCGFGGLFCVKYPDISAKMVDAKVDDILETGAETLLGGDMGCLMNMSGRLQRRGAKVNVRHVAEVLAGTTGDTPPIGEDQ